jgi:hypothetical protein
MNTFYRNKIAQIADIKNYSDLDNYLLVCPILGRSRGKAVIYEEASECLTNIQGYDQTTIKA